MFMLLSSWQSHLSWTVSPPTGHYWPHPALPFIIITQRESQYSVYRLMTVESWVDLDTTVRVHIAVLVVTNPTLRSGICTHTSHTLQSGVTTRPLRPEQEPSYTVNICSRWTSCGRCEPDVTWSRTWPAGRCPWRTTPGPSHRHAARLAVPLNRCPPDPTSNSAPALWSPYVITRHNVLCHINLDKPLAKYTCTYI